MELDLCIEFVRKDFGCGIVPTVFKKIIVLLHIFGGYSVDLVTVFLDQRIHILVRIPHQLVVKPEVHSVHDVAIGCLGLEKGRNLGIVIRQTAVCVPSENTC